MAVGYETKTNQESVYDRPPDIVERTNTQNVAENYIELYGLYTMDVWKATDEAPERVVVTEREVAQLNVTDDTMSLLHVQAESFHNNLYNTPLKGYFDYLGIRSDYQEGFIGGAAVTLEYPDPDTLNQRVKDLDGDDKTSPLEFVRFEGDDYTSEQFLEYLSEGKVPMSSDSWTRPHDVFFHVGAWAALPPALRGALFARTDELLADYRSVQDNLDLRNQDHRDKNNAPGVFLAVLDRAVSNYGILKYIQEDRGFNNSDDPHEFSMLESQISEIISQTRRDLPGADMKKQTLDRIKSAMSLAT